MISKNKATTILFIFFLVCLVLPTNKVNASTAYTFEGDAIGAVPAGWLDTSSGSCSARVSDDVAHGGTKSVKLIDSNNAGWSILEIQSVFDETEITFYLYMYDTDNGIAVYTYEGTVAGNDRLAIVSFNTDNIVKAYDVHVLTTLIDPYVKEHWYKVRIVMDFGSNTYDCYIDDVLEADDFGFYDGGAVAFNAMRFVSGKTNANGIQGYVDDVWIGEVTYEPPDDPNLLFGAGFNDSIPYVELHWNHSLERVLVFEVQNSSDGVSWEFLGNSTTANYTDTQVYNGTERYYRVRANNFTDGSWWNSSFSEINFETVYFIGEIGNGMIEDNFFWVFIAIVLSIITALLVWMKFGNQ